MYFQVHIIGHSPHRSNETYQAKYNNDPPIKYTLSIKATDMDLLYTKVYT